MFVIVQWFLQEFQHNSNLKKHQNHETLNKKKLSFFMATQPKEIVQAVRKALFQMHALSSSTTNKKFHAFSATALYKELQNSNDMNRLKGFSKSTISTTKEWIDIIRQVCETDVMISSIESSSRYFIDIEQFQKSQEKQ